MKIIEKYSFGIGDRFSMQGKAQLKAIIRANKAGVPVVPVWNKSNREHAITGTKPLSTWEEAEQATKEMMYSNHWYVDADHINLSTVDNYIDYANFFTIDVADYIGREIVDSERLQMTQILEPYKGSLSIPGIKKEFIIDDDVIDEVVSKFYFAIKEAAIIYNRIEELRGNDDFVTEISMDEVDQAQSPLELLFILKMISHFGIPAQTIAPKFTGRFNKGVDYAGDISKFRQEFEQDILVIEYAIREFSIPSNLKLSVHSGSDKFSIYPIIGELIKKHNKGIHVKTAGTTWIEEVIGLAMAGGEALSMAKDIYRQAYNRMDELCKPYATVIDIVPEMLPLPEDVELWDSKKFASTVRHIPGHPDYDPMVRQLLHVGYKIASEMGDQYREMILSHQEIVGEQVMENIYHRHLSRLFNIES